MVNKSLAFELTLAQIERRMNQALAYSLEWPEIAARLDKTTLRCEIPMLKQEVYIRIADQSITLHSQGLQQVDLVISATPSALLDFLKQKKAGKNIHISGDASLAQTLQRAAQDLKIDWEGLLADEIGQTPARQASQFFRSIKQVASKFHASFISDLSDYWVVEAQHLPDHHEVEKFNQELTRLRYDTDRLEARIKRLEN